MSVKYHPGEIEVQERAGLRSMAERVGNSIRPTIPSAAREFLEEQPMVVVGSVGADGCGPPCSSASPYVWGDRTLETHRCRVCGCVSHWVAMDPGVDLMGVNARLMDPEVLSAARTRYSAGP